MPQLGETVTEGTITKWFKSVGDRVERDEPLFEVSTDKVDSEVPSPAEGVLTAILVEEGDTVDVGVTLATIGDTATSGGSAAPATPHPAAEPADPSAGPRPATQAGPSDAPPAAPPAAPVPEVAQEPAAPVPATRAVSPAFAATPSPAAAPANGSGSGLVLSPVVRRLLNDNALDPASVRGTGLGGRITRSDVESAIADGGATTSAAPAPVPSIADAGSVPSTAARPPAPAAPAAPVAPVAPAPPVAPAAPAPQAPSARPPAPAAPAAPLPSAPAGTSARDEVVPFTNIRRRTAEHMVRSKATSAHTLMVKEIDYERVEQVRRAHGDRFKAEEGFGLTYLPFAARATVEALAEFPHLNSSVGDDALIVHHDVNLGIAVDLDNEGLIVPVVHNAEELNLRGMARRIRDLAERARNKRLSLDDISGGTFSITNAGPFGTFITGAIINQPQVAILSTDGVSRKPVVVELPDGTESITIHSIGLAAMSFDHRAVDGAYVARFLSRLSQILDERDWAGEL
jgi:pyruvate dehydrogenase E2 component (dihydrolipoamide acetyltransferase)